MTDVSNKPDGVVPQDPRSRPTSPPRDPRAARVRYVVESEPIEPEEDDE